MLGVKIPVATLIVNSLDRSPIVLFVYARPEHTRKVLQSLAQNKEAIESDLIIYSDGPKNEKTADLVAEVRTIVAHVSGFKSVTTHFSSENKGLSQSIISGVSEVLRKYSSCIVLEDDLVLSPHFLSFMNDGLSKYSADSRVASIHGYVYPTQASLPENFFMKGADCWGWGTWKRAWDLFESDGSKLLEQLKKRGLINEFDFGGSYAYSGLLKKQIERKVDSWAIRWHASIFLENMLTLYPGKSLVHNIGNDRSGTNSGQYNIFDVSLQKSPLPVTDIEVEPSEIGYKAFVEFFIKNKQTLSAKVIRKISSLVNHEKE
jgi:hypothetical protein